MRSLLEFTQYSRTGTCRDPGHRHTASQTEASPKIPLDDNKFNELLMLVGSTRLSIFIVIPK
ncbi:MAG: Uncharacterised protein [Opitutia bacterium UBA7350]|nr:MAG: Uncharacterised protein [Opitutae bacterium UBA7350]